MRLVVDASVMIAAIVNEGSLGIWARTLIADEDMLTPDILPYEVTQVLRKMERSGDLNRMQAEDAFRFLSTSDIRLIRFKELGARVWQLRHNLTSYDAAYIATAEIAQAPLATLDLKMASQPVDCEFLTPP